MKKNWTIEKQVIKWKLNDEELTAREAKELLAVRQLQHPGEVFRLTKVGK